MRSNHNILLIDDEDNDAILIKRALSKAEKHIGFQRVSDGEEGVAYLAGQREFKDRAAHPWPDLVVLDLKMPRKNGFEVLKWIRGHENTKLLPVVVFTSSKEPADINKAYELGANAFMVKPASFEHLIDVMKIIHSYWIRHCLIPDGFSPRKFGDKPSHEDETKKRP
jgi:CheY-like chemotaxis protein